MKNFLFLLLCIITALAMVSCSSDKEIKSLQGAYDDIISKYTELLTTVSEGGKIQPASTDGMNKRESDISEAIYGTASSWDPESVERLGYGYKDLDKNGTEELIFINNFNRIKAIFTVSDGAPILLESGYDSGNYIYFASKQRLFMEHEETLGNLRETTYFTCRVDGNKMVYDSVYGQVKNTETYETTEMFQITEGKRTTIDSETFYSLYGEQEILNTSPQLPDYCKLEAPYIHYPLADTDKEKDVPTADFSDYQAVLDTYVLISERIDKFDEYKWITGEYDNLFSFTDDASYNCYKYLLYAAYTRTGGVGYGEADINKDGQNELLLLNEDYSIKAIFTKKQGKPVLVGAYGYDTCWLDEKGLIHVDTDNYDSLEYSLYELTDSGDCKSVYSILATKRGYRYLTQDNIAKQISFDESMEIYNDYCCYPEPFETTEHTRNIYHQLTFTPLNNEESKITEDALKETWHKYTDLRKTTNKDFASGNTYITFENIGETQIKMKIKYAFTFYYPDPDADNHVLDNTEESFLDISISNTNGVFTFDEQGIKGNLEFRNDYLWLIIEESTDERFAVGHHCYEIPYEW